MAPVPADKISEAVKILEDDLELAHDGSVLSPSGELKPDSINSDVDDIEDSRDDSYFEKEVIYKLVLYDSSILQIEDSK